MLRCLMRPVLPIFPLQPGPRPGDLLLATGDKASEDKKQDKAILLTLCNNHNRYQLCKRRPSTVTCPWLSKMQYSSWSGLRTTWNNSATSNKYLISIYLVPELWNWLNTSFQWGWFCTEVQNDVFGHNFPGSVGTLWLETIDMLWHSIPIF